jgi:geranylgeranyl diphosphate synthase type II
MDATSRIEQALTAVLAPAESIGCPPQLPGGARIRPRLCLAVARANAEDDRSVSNAAAASIELLHCASLVHDDLPCFDNADMRRGKLSVHRAFGERLGVLVGDALIVQAFQTLANGASRVPQRLAALLQIVGNSVGTSAGIVAGQAWECEPRVGLSDYQKAKTGALFAAASMAGAAAAGCRYPESWRALGERLGEAYQVADDILDVVGNPLELGKPTGRDALLSRPNAPRELGMHGALQRLEYLVAGAIDSIPACPGADELRAIIMTEAAGLLPEKFRHAA